MHVITDIKNSVQQSILSKLYAADSIRFKDLKPSGIETNLYSYHLKSLLKKDLIVKNTDGYSYNKFAALSAVSNRAVATSNVQTIYVIQNSDGDVLLKKRHRQPFGGMYSLPGGIVEDVSLTLSQNVASHVSHFISASKPDITRAGDCYIRVVTDNTVLYSMFFHVFRFEVDNIVDDDSLVWARPHKLNQLQLTPCVEQIMARTFFRDSHFFEEFTETW